MTKKRLSDLLREEVNLDTSVDTSPAEETQTTASESRSNRSRLTKVQLETQVDELTIALDAAHQEIASLQAQIAQLESTSQQQEALETAKTEQSEGEKSNELVNHLETELAEQTKLIEKLYAELQKAEAKLTPTPPPSAAKQSPKESRSGIQLVNRYVAPLQPTSNLSNEDIGWFD